MRFVLYHGRSDARRNRGSREVVNGNHQNRKFSIKKKKEGEREREREIESAREERRKVIM